MSDRPFCFLAFPMNERCDYGAARGYFEALHGTQQLHVEGDVNYSSFVPRNYNILLHKALKYRDLARINHQIGPSLFAMIHSDVAPVGVLHKGQVYTWLDILYAELLEHNADAICAVVPIKEPNRNKTSTVIASPENPWHPKRFLLMSDRGTMPETFGIEHVGDPKTEILQINTGCMLVRLDRPWWDIPRRGAEGDFFAFELMQRTIKQWRTKEEIEDEQSKTGMKALPFERITQSRSEDWEMSRHIHEHGGRVMATWKVTLEHWGPSSWCNQDKVAIDKPAAKHENGKVQEPVPV